MEFLEYIKLFAPVIMGERHNWYKRTVDLADMYKRYITGEGMSVELRRFNKREDDALFEQRLLITQHISSSVLDNVNDIFYKVPRSFSMNRILESKDEKRLEELEEIMDGFWGVDSLDDYMATRWLELNFIDPNTFVVIEWGDFDNKEERAKPYPFEIKSKDVMNYEFENKVLQWLMGRSSEMKIVPVKNKAEEIEVFSFMLYLKDGSIKFEQIYDEELVKLLPKELELVGIGEDKYVKIHKDHDFIWRIVEVEHKLGYVPAYRVGYKRDQFSDGAIFVSPYNGGMPYLKKMVNTVSEMDLTVALHVFPKLFQYVKRCSNSLCQEGKVYHQNEEEVACKSCGGLGYEVHTSAQDAVLLPLPFKPEDIIDLSGLAYSHKPEIDLITFQKEYIEYLVEQVKATVFNSDIFTRQEIQESATGKNIGLQNVYDTLYPCSVAYGNTWGNYVGTVADITDLKEGLIYLMTFGKDFKLKTLDDLYRELKVVTESNADNFIKVSVQDDIAQIIYSDDPYSMQKYMVKKKFFPFSGMTQEQIMFVMSSNTVREFDKVLWSNYGNIFDRLEMKDEDFYIHSQEKQWEMIKEEVESIMEDTKVAPPTFNIEDVEVIEEEEEE